MFWGSEGRVKSEVSDWWALFEPLMSIVSSKLSQGCWRKGPCQKALLYGSHYVEVHVSGTLTTGRLDSAWDTIGDPFYYILRKIIKHEICLKTNKRNDNGVYITDAEKKLCKNVYRLHRATFEKINVCGMFYVDATFPLKVLALVTSYTFVLLQFAFL